MENLIFYFSYYFVLCTYNRIMSVISIIFVDLNTLTEEYIKSINKHQIDYLKLQWSVQLRVTQIWMRYIGKTTEQFLGDALMK
jgi:hypothetical protein